MTDKELTHKEIAQRIRNIMCQGGDRYAYLGNLVNLLDPPKPNIDKTIRGWIWVKMCSGNLYVKFADDFGVWDYEMSSGDDDSSGGGVFFEWNDLDLPGHGIESMTIIRIKDDI